MPVSLVARCRSRVASLVLALCLPLAPTGTAAAVISSHADLKTELARYDNFDLSLGSALVDSPTFFNLFFAGGPVEVSRTIQLEFRLTHWAGDMTIQFIAGRATKDNVLAKGFLKHITNPHPTDVAGGVVFWDDQYRDDTPASSSDEDPHRSRVADHLDVLDSFLTGTTSSVNQILDWRHSVTVRHTEPVPPRPPSLPLPGAAAALLTALAGLALVRRGMAFRREKVQTCRRNPR